MKKLLFLFLITLCSACTLVDSSETAVKVDRLGDEKGNINPVPVRGYVFYVPWLTDVFTCPNYILNVDYPDFSVNTKDGSSITVDVSLSYMILQEKVGYIFKKYRRDYKDIEKGYMARAVYDAYRSTANSFTVDSLMSNREDFDNNLQLKLSKTLNDEGFFLEQITGRIDPPESIKKAIDNKNQSVQIALQSENKIRQAEAEARSLKIKADAEAYANKTLAASITSALIDKMKLDKWDGKLPIVSGGNSIIDLKQFK